MRISGYWKDHFVFDKKSKASEKKIGKLFIESIVVNCIVPMLFVYGKKKDDPKKLDQALSLLEEIKPERNKIIKLWEPYEMPINHAGDSQALIHLYNNYCSNKRCASCKIGNAVIDGIKAL